MSKVQLEASADIRLVYTVEELAFVDYRGDTILVDRVFVQYWYPVEDENYPFSIDIEGWPTTKAGKRDKRAKDRTHVFMKWNELVKFVNDDLGIDYEADFAKFWKVGA